MVSSNAVSNPCAGIINECARSRASEGSAVPGSGNTGSCLVVLCTIH